MREERGIVLAGDVMPGTDWCRRVPGMWWASGRGTRAKAAEVNVFCGHWTGGEAGTKSYEDDGPWIFNMMRNRKRPDGSPLDVGIAFVVGACAPDDPEAPVWQLADPALVATVHVGTGYVNARSIGVEVVNAGMPGEANARHRPAHRVRYLGKQRDVLLFYPGQIRSFVRLANALSARDLPGGIRIPRRVPVDADGGLLTDRRFSVGEARRWKGAMEHFLCPGTKKLDAAGMLLAALSDHGWEGVRP